MEKFLFGMLLGVCAGAVLTTNNGKMRTLVKKGQDEIKEKLDDMLEEKTKMLGSDEEENQSGNAKTQKQTKPTQKSKKQKKSA